jgi:dipeptidyl aminopeptidase/acylaminoacyl peptidase
LAYLLEPKPESANAQGRGQDAAGAANPRSAGGARQSGAAGSGGRQGGARGAAGNRGGATRTEYGADLVVRNLTDKNERTMPDVVDFSFSRDARNLTYTVSSRTAENNGVYRMTPGTADAPAAILSGKGRYTRLSWDQKQTQLAFFSDRDDAAAAQPKVKIYYTDFRTPSAVELISAATQNSTQGFVITERAGISFSQDRTRIFFGAAPPATTPENTDETAAQAAPATAGEEEKVVADLWHWKDDFIQPMQKVRATQDANRTCTVAFNITEKKLIMAAKNFSAPTKAKTADVYPLTAQTFNEFPDLQVCGPAFSDMKKVSSANPQKAQLLWGTSELIRYKNSDGVPLSGILIKPENFDPARKYPMMVYIYELLSNNVYNFVNPAPGHSINVS